MGDIWAVDSGHVPAARSVPDKEEDRNLLHGFRQADFTVDQSDIRFVP